MDKNKKLSVMVVGVRGFPGVQGGVETHTQHLCTSLVELGCNVEVIVRSAYQSNEYAKSWRNVKFRCIWASRSKSIEAIVHTLLGVLYAAIKRPDVLHIQAIGPALMTPLARLLGLRVIVTHHGPDYDRQKWGGLAKAMLRLGELVGMRFSSNRIVISNVIKELVQHKHGRDSALIPNGIYLPVLPVTSKVLTQFGLEAKRYVLLVSRLVPEKRHHDLINAFSLAAMDGWKLVLVGASDHPDAYARSVLQVAENTDKVVCTGFQSGTALKELYAHAGVFVLPSSHEGLPIALLEALSFGLPVLASDIPANLEVACDGITYYELGNVFALSELLQVRALAAPEKVYGEQMRQYVAEKYKWSVIAQRTYAVYAGTVQQNAVELQKI